MDTDECVICLNNISKNEEFILTCCKNNVHIYCLNSWVKKNITNKNIGKCFICSQENSMLETLVVYNIYENNNYTIIVDNSNEILINNDYSNSIINRNNNINYNNNENDIILVNDTYMLDMSYATDKRLYYLVISIKLIFLIFFSSLLILVLYIIT
jgi:hypothetical protein